MISYTPKSIETQNLQSYDCAVLERNHGRWHGAFKLNVIIFWKKSHAQSPRFLIHKLWIIIQFILSSIIILVKDTIIYLLSTAKVLTIKGRLVYRLSPGNIQYLTDCSHHNILHMGDCHYLLTHSVRPGSTIATRELHQLYNNTQIF